MPIDRELLRQLEHAVRPLRTAIANLGARGVVSLVDDSKKMQLVQLGAIEGGPYDGAEHFQPYGFSSVPLPPDAEGAPEAAVMFPSGDRGHPIVFAVADRRHRRTNAPPGDVTMRHYSGAMVTFTSDGDIILEPANGRQVLAREDGGTAQRLLTEQDGQILRAAIAGAVISLGAGGAATINTAMDIAVAALPGPPSPPTWPVRTKTLLAE
jgi:phage gp45-like